MRSTRLAALAAVLFAAFSILIVPTRAFGQFVVDCTGNTPGAYTTINSVIPLLYDGAVVRITGPCTENVTIAGIDHLNIGAAYGQTATLNGNLTINNLQDMYLYGMNVTNPNGDGIDINGSHDVTLDSCTSSNNADYGLNISTSDVTVQGGAAFNNNGNTGIEASNNGELYLNGYGAPITINNNLGDGIYLEDGVITDLGNTIISNNILNTSSTAPSTGSGFGLDFWGHARAVFYEVFGPDVISGNQAGGVAIHEGSEISLSGPEPASASSPATTIVDGNGPVGVSAGFGSQVTIWGGVQISNHTDAGVDVYGHSQVFINGIDQITNNGTGPASTYPARAGVRVDGNSEAYIRGGQISQNGGPGILALANSSVDVTGATLTPNLGGPIQCDTSAWLVTDRATVPSAYGFASPCRIPNSFGPGFRGFAPRIPSFNIGKMRAQEAKYRQLISSF